ncbi:hypothetical protein MNBD_NITROSPINAE03-1564 [hydrothermal vent metagenome]|uniref:Uncharacterized protein n=1 Tax=hydrothermal vent metagenome TaxID=652676 RepID=A0A3B1BS87_9ZZZZ
MKNIILVIDQPPDGKTAEKLRMGVGLILDDGNKVSALLIDEGVFTASGLAKDNAPAWYEIDKHLETFEALEMDLVAHEPSARDRNLTLDRFGIRMAGDEEVSLLLDNADIVIT